MKLIQPLLFSFAFFATSLCAQRTVSIEDPDLFFSYTLPEGWSNIDDPYYHYILFSENDSVGPDRIAITYFDRYCRVAKDCFDGEYFGGLRNELDSFKSLATGTEKVAGQNADWGRFQFKAAVNDAAMLGYFYTFQNGNQFFLITAQAEAGKMEKFEPMLLKWIKTFGVKPK